MAYQAWSVVYGEQPSAAKWNILGTNDASFNDGTGIADGAIAPAKLATYMKGGTIDITATGNLSATGLGFTPRSVQFFLVDTISGTTLSGAYGYMDATVQWSMCWFANEGTGDTSNRASTDTYCILTSAANSAADITAARQSLDADGFTINVSAKTNNATFGYIAYG